MALRTAFTFYAFFNAALAGSALRSLDPVRTVFQFPVDTFFENLAVRPNGEILTSLLSQPQLFVIDPEPASGSPQPVLVHEFTESLGLAGIAEFEPDIFAVIAGRFNISSGDVGPGTWDVWSVDMNGVSVQEGTLSGSPKINLIANGTFLLSDINAGVIYRLDTQGNYEIVINSTLTHSVPEPPFPPAGVDGLHVHNDGNSKTLYFVNAGQGFFASVAINNDGIPLGDIEIVARPLGAPNTYDDFTLDCEGNIYLVTAGGNGIELISTGGQQTIIAGNVNSTAIAESTSAAFGRGPNDKNILYVSTVGGMDAPVDGDMIIGAQLVAVTTNSQGSAACALNL